MTKEQEIKALKAQVRMLGALLREASVVLKNHHSASFTMAGHSTCPACDKTGNYPQNIFGRIETALDITCQSD